MRSLILTTTSILLRPMLVIFSVFILLRGHNEPGGGFAGGLIAAAAFSLLSLTAGVSAARRRLRVRPQTLIGTGLLFAGGSGTLSLIAGKPFLTGLWGVLPGPFGPLPIGSALLFDGGVYLVVMGMVLLVVFTLMEDAK